MYDRRVFLGAFTVSLFAGLTSAPAALAGVSLPPERQRQIDALFADFDTPTSPGCALGVMSDGRMIYARGYGMANIAAGLANDSTRLFEIASDSKQFTAGAIVRLAQQGKLKLTDDIRKYIPELPNYGNTITINNLLWHTGGLRDYGFLLGMAGSDDSDVVTEAQVLALLLKQRKPDFAPGTRYEYSNTGYFLLGLIVKRVSGLSLNDYTRRQFFTPLGMPLSVWRDKHDKVVPNQALGYDLNDADQYVVTMSNWEPVGDGGLQTSVEEIQKWDENFYTGQVGGPEFISEMYHRGTLADGTALTYARGLDIHPYRGLQRITHGGDWAGYKSQTQRFPNQHTSVMLMCNAGEETDLDQYELSDEIDDIVLADYFTQPKPTGPQPAPSLPLPRFVGHWFSSTAQDVTETYIDPKSNQLVLRSEGAAQPLTSIGPSAFYVTASPDTRVNFTVQGSNPATQLAVIEDALDLNAKPIRSSRFTPVTATNPSQYTGTFKAPEFDGIEWTLTVSNGQLQLRKSKDAPGDMAGPLQPANAADTFYGKGGYFRFTRDAQGCINGFYLSRENSTDYRFNKQ